MFTSIEEHIKLIVLDYFSEIDIAIPPKTINVKRTDEHVSGDLTLLIFPLSKYIKKPLEQIATAIATKCKEKANYIADFEIIGGFLNFTIKDQYWLDFVIQYHTSNFWKTTPKSVQIVVEFSSPNTNKPLHLGHLKNNFLGVAISNILKEVGYKVHKTCVVNDRGMHICKSMIAWQKFANGATPASTNKKGDHFVGDYYVLFEQELKRQTRELQQKVEQGEAQHLAADQLALLQKLIGIIKHKKAEGDIKKVEAKYNETLRANTTIMAEVRQMLILWEQRDKPTMDLWKKMNNWVYEGFEATYQKIGTSFDSIDYESECYLKGKDIVQEGLRREVFYQKDDGSIWVDLTDKKLDQKLLMRGDQTSVYITQDLGLINQRYQKLSFDSSIYVVGNEQEYHFNVLKAIIQKLDLPYSEGIYHLSYGMVELPSGKMKSREGTVVDADNIIEEVIQLAEATAKEVKKVDVSIQQPALYYQIGLGALKFHLLKVHPAKTNLFDPKDSIDMQGFTGPFIQYAYARIASILRQLAKVDISTIRVDNMNLELAEKKLIMHLELFPAILVIAANQKDPSELALYLFSLAKKFNSFYTHHSILKAENEQLKSIRIAICMMTKNILERGLGLLGIENPERM